MKILVTGADGQLGRALRDALDPNHEIVWTDRGELDINDPAALRAATRSFRPDAIMHLAALTQVDDCERDPEAAFTTNTLGTRHVAQLARELSARLFFISSDYVFDGCLGRAYQEYDTPMPLNVYGWTKLHGERAVAALVSNHVIVRTSGLFGQGGTNFVAAVLAARERDGRVRVVNDQVCRPTYAGDLAGAIARMLAGGACGTYHVASAGPVSWFEFAQAALQAAGSDPAAVIPISSRELDRPARRPAYSVLDTRAYEAVFGMTLPHWRAGLARCVAHIRGTGGAC